MCIKYDGALRNGSLNTVVHYGALRPSGEVLTRGGEQLFRSRGRERWLRASGSGRRGDPESEALATARASLTIREQFREISIKYSGALRNGSLNTVAHYYYLRSRSLSLAHR